MRLVKKVFIFYSRTCRNCVDLFSNDKGRHEKLAIAVHVLQNTCDFAEDGKEMYKDLKRMCRTTVLVIKPFVW